MLIPGLSLVIATEAVIIFYLLAKERRRAIKRASQDAALLRTGLKAVAGEMIPTIIHELAQPLSVIRGYAELLLLTHIKGDDKAVEYLNTSVDCTTRIQTIMNTLKQTANPPRTGVTPGTDPAALLRETLDDFQEQLTRHGIRVTETIEPALPALPLEPGVFRLVLLNLLSNARDALDLAGKGERRIDIELRRREDRLLFILTDNGPGMTPGVLEQCRDLFFTTKPEGTGIGLPATEAAIRAARGTFTIVSAPSEGTRIDIDLPIKEESHV